MQNKEESPIQNAVIFGIMGKLEYMKRLPDNSKKSQNYEDVDPVSMNDLLPRISCDYDSTSERQMES